MVAPWLSLLLIFSLVVLSVQLGQTGIKDVLSRRRRTLERFAALEPADRSRQTIDALRRRASRPKGLALVARLDLLLLQSGLAATPRTVGLVFLALWSALVILMPAALTFPLNLMAAAAAASLAIYGYLRTKRARRVARFGEQLPDVIEVIVRSLRAGHPLPVSLSLVAREMPAPAGPEFTILVDEVNYGRDVGDALEALYRRVGHPDLRFLVASIAIAYQTGGNLGEILSRLSRMLRDRFRLRRKIRALSSEGRFSGYVLSLLPVALFGLINLVSPSYYADFWASPAHPSILAVSIGLLLLGNLTIYKIVNFKV